MHHVRMSCVAVAAFALQLPLSASTGPAHSSEQERLRRGEEIVTSLNAGKTQPTLEALRRDFPFLADAITGYALGDVWGRPVLDHRTRQLATVAAFAALGHLSIMKVHAGYALNVGVTPEELKEIVYLTTVHAGFPRAIEAANTLKELFDERAVSKGATR
jgi:4-carboxymuconolactone decarboxylase